MKKFLKIFGFATLICGLVALVICYIVIPDQTRMAMDVVVSYLNKPLPIIGISIIVLGFVVYKILSRTSFGKKGLAKLQKDFCELKSSYDNLLANYKSYKEKAEKTLLESKAVLESYSSEIDTLSNNLVKACETSPNAKIKAIGERIKEQYIAKKKELVENLEKDNNELAEILNKPAQVIIDENKLKEQVIKLLEELNYGEQNSNANKE